MRHFLNSDYIFRFLVAAPSNYEDNAEVGRNSDDDNSMIGRYTESDDVDTMTQRAITKINGVDDDSPNGYSKSMLMSFYSLQIAIAIYP